jgi:hypothetical protein
VNLSAEPNAMIQRVAIALFVLTSLSVNASYGQSFNQLSLVNLDKQLNAILKTRLPEEKQYVASVVNLVGENKIPLSMVNSSFKWVLNRRPYVKNRFVYFVRVLQFQGKRDKIQIPKFDFGVYSVSER